MLERFFKKYLWAVNLLLLFLAAWLSAKAVNTFVAVVIRPTPRVDLSLPVTLAPRQSAQVALDPQKLYRLIGLEAPEVQEALAAAASARPQTWWHWMNGNITKDGIKKDLLWMHRVGIGGFQNFDAALATPQIVEKRLTYMTPDWIDAFRVRNEDRVPCPTCRQGVMVVAEHAIH